MAQITPAEFAVQVKSTGREVRKFLRSITPKEDQPGKGARWALEGNKREVTKLQKQFTEWKAAQEKAREDREAAAEVETPEVEETEDIETEDELETE